MNLSVRTVETHRSNVFERLFVASAVELARLLHALHDWFACGAPSVTRRHTTGNMKWRPIAATWPEKLDFSGSPVSPRSTCPSASQGNQNVWPPRKMLKNRSS